MLALLLCLLCVPLLLALFEALAEKRDLRRYPPPGRLVSAGSSRLLHIVQQGTAGPAVILESGLTASSLSWVLTQPAISEFAQVAAYDRAGLGWSSPANSPLTLDSLLSDLQTVIQHLALPTPAILVGHSFGALLVRAFASRHPNRVAGLVLIDPVSLDTYANPDANHRRRLQTGIRLSHRGAMLARFGVVRGALSLVASGSRKLPSFIGRISAGKGNSVLTRLASEVAKLPPETHGPIRSHWSRPNSFRLMAGYLRLLPDAARQALKMPLPQIPVIVLSAASAQPSELAERELWTSHHPSSRHSQVPNTSHWLQLDRSDLVVAAVRELALLIK